MMKKIATLLTIAIFSNWQLAAQEPSPYLGRPLQITHIGHAFGGDIEMPHGLDYQYLLSTAEGVEFDYNGLPFSKGEMTKMKCDNPTVRFNLSFRPAVLPNTVVMFSLLGIEGRIDEVRYEASPGDPRGWEYLEVSATNQETALEAALLRRFVAGKTFRFYTGIGLNAGLSYNGEVRVKGYLQDDAITDVPANGNDVDLTYQQKPSLNQRLFVQAGVGIRFFKHMEFGLESRRGIGSRATFDGPFHMTILKRSIGFSLRYSFL
ncbi:MAG: hypothetical protein H6577_12235 [Lewinellaceae bacterium]|nr:hypothetical protein [Saprospiraceae bacterium]MCB9338888.1 hypothetical protein [Lewinellaceae bacterium]